MQELHHDEKGAGGKLVFARLAELFRSRATLDKPLAFPDDYHPTYVPICQHNIYKYTPFTFEPIVEEPERSEERLGSLYRVVFPENKLSLIQQLDWPWEGEPCEVQDATPYPIKCEEERGKRMMEIRFRSSSPSDLEDLRYQLYLSHVNLYNLEQWFNPLKDVEVCSSRGETYRVLRPSSLIDLTPEEVGRIEDLHEKASFGRYPVSSIIAIL